MGASPAQGGHRRANYSLETGEDNYTHQNGGGGDFSFQNGGVHVSQSLGDYRLQNGSQLWLNGGDYHRQNGGTSDSQNRGRGSADFLRQNGDVADHVLRQNGGNDAKRSGGESASIEPQHRRLNGDYGQLNGGEEGGETAYPGRSEQYARNWPPVSQSPADKLQSKKVRMKKKTQMEFEKTMQFCTFF
jgi:hypothetical protein